MRSWRALVVYLAYVAAFPWLTLAFYIPSKDAPNCIARASNTGLLLWNGEFFQALSEAFRGDPNNFLANLTMGAFSALVGPGRFAWGIAWASLLALSILGHIYFLKNKVSVERLLSFGLAPLLMGSSVASLQGGIFDQRFDPLAVTLLCLAISAFLGGNGPWACRCSFWPSMPKERRYRSRH